MNHEKTIKFIQNNFNKQQQGVLIKYINSEFFENDLNELMFRQSFMGEPLPRAMAIECLLESYIQMEIDTEQEIVDDIA